MVLLLLWTVPFLSEASTQKPSSSSDDRAPYEFTFGIGGADHSACGFERTRFVGYAFPAPSSGKLNLRRLQFRNATGSYEFKLVIYKKVPAGYSKVFEGKEMLALEGRRSYDISADSVNLALDEKYVFGILTKEGTGGASLGCNTWSGVPNFPYLTFMADSFEAPDLVTDMEEKFSYPPHLLLTGAPF